MHLIVLGDTESLDHNQHEFLGDPVPDKSADDTGKVASSSNLVQPKTERKKENWLRLDNPLVYIVVTMLASVLAGVLLMLIKC